MFRLDNDWDELLESEFKSDYYQRLRQFLKKEYSTKVIYPDMYKIFEALRLTSYADTRVVILGQDPYHGPKQAHGLAFSVQKGIAIPPSLLNIYKELESDCGCYMPNNGYLVPWADQGVLLLNASLTVVAGQANSHRGMGWEIFTDSIIKRLNKKESPLVFLLWGNKARAKASLVDNPNHLILASAHQAPYRPIEAFLAANTFQRPIAF